jgi:hypothetical protein
MKERKPEPEEVVRIRQLLKHWDDGIITLGEFEIEVNKGFKETLFNLMREGKDYGEATAGCFSSDAPPTVKIDIELEIFANGFWMRPKK